MNVAIILTRIYYLNLFIKNLNSNLNAKLNTRIVGKINIFVPKRVRKIFDTKYHELMIHNTRVNNKSNNNLSDKFFLFLWYNFLVESVY